MYSHTYTAILPPPAPNRPPRRRLIGHGAGRAGSCMSAATHERPRGAASAFICRLFPECADRPRASLTRFGEVRRAAAVSVSRTYCGARYAVAVFTRPYKFGTKSGTKSGTKFGTRLSLQNNALITHDNGK